MLWCFEKFPNALQQWQDIHPCTDTQVSMQSPCLMNFIRTKILNELMPHGSQYHAWRVSQYYSSSDDSAVACGINFTSTKPKQAR
jgi:hypothetical protein